VAHPPRIVSLPALLIMAACNGTAPDPDTMLRVEGRVLEEGQPPLRPLAMDIQAWPSLENAGTDFVVLQTDPAGAYTAELGRFPGPVVDSVRVGVIQNDCDGEFRTELRHAEHSLDGNTLTLPALALSDRLPMAQLGTGQAMCAATRTQVAGGQGGDYARLALWIDGISDSVRGRWRLNHSASIGDDYGYFSGFLGSDALTLQLRPTGPTLCTGLGLEMGVSDISATLGPANLLSNGDCFISNTTLRFFEGAVLSEVLPPI